MAAVGQEVGDFIRGCSLAISARKHRALLYFQLTALVFVIPIGISVQDPAAALLLLLELVLFLATRSGDDYHSIRRLAVERLLWLSEKRKLQEHVPPGVLGALDRAAKEWRKASRRVRLLAAADPEIDAVVQPILDEIMTDAVLCAKPAMKLSGTGKTSPSAMEAAVRLIDMHTQRIRNWPSEIDFAGNPDDLIAPRIEAAQKLVAQAEEELAKVSIGDSWMLHPDGPTLL